MVGIGCLASTSVAAPEDVILEWNQRLLQTIRQTNGIPYGFPGPVSRCIAIVYTWVYDAVNSVTPTHEPYHQLMPCPPGTSAEAAAAYHAMSMVYAVAPLQQAGFNALYAAQLARIPDGPAPATSTTTESSTSMTCCSSWEPGVERSARSAFLKENHP